MRRAGFDWIDFEMCIPGHFEWKVIYFPMSDKSKPRILTWHKIDYHAFLDWMSDAGSNAKLQAK